LRSGYCDKIARSLDEALKLIDAARKDRQSISIGLVGNCADVLPEIAKRGIVPDVLTDQTSAHDALNGYVPNGMTLEEALALRTKNPDAYIERFHARHGCPCRGNAGVAKKGRRDFRLWKQHSRSGEKGRHRETHSIFPGLFRNTFGRSFAKGAAASAGLQLSGDPEDIAPHGSVVRSTCFRKTQTLAPG